MALLDGWARKKGQKGQDESVQEKADIAALENVKTLDRQLSEASLS